MLRNNRGQFGLVGMLVVLVIIAILAYVFIPKYLKAGSPVKPMPDLTPELSSGSSAPTPGDAPQAPSRVDPPRVDTTIQRQYGGSPECNSNLHQIRLAIQRYEDMNNEKPSSIKELESLGVIEEISKCGVTKKPYCYDPATGRVSCTTPGHTKY